MKEKHGEAIDILESELSEKENMMNETDSRMSMISVYVDQLEERLASFAILRREITEREVTCQELEQKDLELTEELKSIRDELVEVKMERVELKKLSELLVQERVILQEEKQYLTEEKDSLIFEKESLSKEIISLKNDFETVKAELDGTVSELQDVKQELSVKDESMFKLKEESATQLAEREKKLSETESLVTTLEANIHDLKLDTVRTTELVTSLEKEIEENMERLKRIDEDKQKKLEANGSDTNTYQQISQQSQWGQDEEAIISCSVGADIHNSPLPFNQESDNYDLSCESLEESMVFNDKKKYAFHQDFDASEDQTKLNTMTTLSTKITVIHLHHCVKKVSSLYPPPSS